MENTGSNDDPEDRIMFDLCIPVCNESLIPVVGRYFPTLEEGEKFYEVYADACGFTTRKSTINRDVDDRTIKSRYVLCNKQGLNDKDEKKAMRDESPLIKKRKTTSTRVDCMARIVFHFEGSLGYRISTFNEGHTHTMTSGAYRYLLKSKRNINPVHKIFIHAGIKANVGPVRAFRFYKEIVGSYEDVGATSNDFKNYSSELRTYVGGVDAQIILDNFKSKKENCSNFQYFFDVDKAGKLNRLFWADDTSIKNYKIFGDAVSFDATYSTNRYKLIFSPFTGRDNHGCCVTFAAGLISHEDVESYTWILEKFAVCMVDHPKLIITDQDPALKIAVPYVFPTTHHRFCLWHITKKIPDKISVALRMDPDFKSNLDGLIWSELDEPAEFEEKWHQLMAKYDLGGHKWFADMFELRSYWIPAYFREITVSGLFKTTSLSESANSFFKRYINMNDDLVRFIMHYNSAIDAQRSCYKSMTFSDETGVPSMSTKLYMEQHAASMYTNKKFYEVQEEIESAVLKCVMQDMIMDGELKVYDIDDGSRTTFRVIYDPEKDFLDCTCKSFVRRGIPCAHMIHVMRTRRVNRIPDVYILKRWSKLSHSGSLIGDESSSSDTGRMIVGNQQLFTEVCKSIVSVNNNTELQAQLLEDLKVLSEKFAKLGVNPDDASTKKDMFELFYGCKIPDKIEVGTPDVAITKGSGVGGRRKSDKEKAIEAANKKLRNCRRCKRLVDHDSRNCPEK